jgi:hypothetical protein
MRNLLPGPTPWRSLFMQRISALSPRKGRKWPPNSYYLRNAIKARGASTANSILYIVYSQTKAIKKKFNN